VELPFAYAYPAYWRIFSDNAFGNYRDIIKAVTLSPAMGCYLNMANNNKGNPVRGTAANENYARELMQLFTLGLVQPKPDGSPVLDAKGNSVPAFNQDVVTNVARILTGWTYPTEAGAIPKANNPPYFTGQMFAVARNHDTEAKAIFGGVEIPAGQTAEADLESLLDALMAQQTMAPFVCRQLIQHLVTSNPSPAYIERVSNAFLDNGRGVRGDMRAVITAILMDSEARAGDDATAHTDSNAGHLREPVLFDEADRELQLVEHLLHPQLFRLVDDDEQHLVVQRGQGLLRPEELVELQIVGIGHAGRCCGHGRGA
jgi:uncharacterized protein (DUF1800 family)